MGHAHFFFKNVLIFNSVNNNSNWHAHIMASKLFYYVFFRDRSRESVCSDYYSSFVIPSRGLPTFLYCFSLADRRKQYKSSELLTAKYHPEKPSDMHTKHECTNPQRRQSRGNNTTKELPYLLVLYSFLVTKIT